MASSPGIKLTWTKALPAFLLAWTLDFTIFWLEVIFIGEPVALIEALIGDFLLPAIFIFGYQIDYNRNATKKFGVTLATAALKPWPVIGALIPAYTIETYMLISTKRKEEMEDAKKNTANDTQGQQEAQRKQTQYQAAADAAKQNGNEAQAAQYQQAANQARATAAQPTASPRPQPRYGGAQKLGAAVRIAKSAALGPEAIALQAGKEILKAKANDNAAAPKQRAA
jgi:hypothetical protein